MQLLTPHQERILQLKLQGLTTREISKKLKISFNSLKSTLTSVYLKLGLNLSSIDNRTERKFQILAAYQNYKKRIDDSPSTKQLIDSTQKSPIDNS